MNGKRHDKDMTIGQRIVSGDRIEDHRLMRRIVILVEAALVRLDSNDNPKQSPPLPAALRRKVNA